MPSEPGVSLPALHFTTESGLKPKNPPSQRGERGWFSSFHPSLPRRTYSVTFMLGYSGSRFDLVSAPSRKKLFQWLLADFVHGYSCGAASVFHRLPQSTLVKLRTKYYSAKSYQLSLPDVKLFCDLCTNSPPVRRRIYAILSCQHVFCPVNLLHLPARLTEQSYPARRAKNLHSFVAPQYNRNQQYSLKTSTSSTESGMTGKVLYGARSLKNSAD